MRNDNSSPPGRAQQTSLAVPNAEWRRPGDIIINEYESQDSEIASAISIIDPETGRCLAWCGPDFPPEHRLAAVPSTDLAELAALFPHPPDAWFGPRVRGLAMEATHSVLRGRTTARDMRSLLGKMLGRPKGAAAVLRSNRVLELCMQMMTALIGDPRGMTAKLLSEMRAAFEVTRGRPANETRAFFLKELMQFAVNYGLDLRLPQHRDTREVGATPFFTFAQTMNFTVVTRVFETQPNPSQEVIHRLAPFRCSPVALLDALERVKKRRKSP